MRFLPTIVWLGYTLLATVDVGRCFVVLGHEKILFHLAKGVLRNDMYWKNIITIEMPVNTDEVDPRVADMLTELGFKNNKLMAQPILRYLATNPGSTRTQLLFGIKILANAISCQLANTLGLNMFFISVYAHRKTVRVDHIREQLSFFQTIVTKYIDKLAMFGQPINLFVTLSNKINELFEHHKENQDVNKQVYLDIIPEFTKLIKVIRDDRCGGPQSENWPVVMQTINVVYFAENLLSKNRYHTVDDLQIASMIESMDQYKFIDFSSLGENFWNKRLDIVKFVCQKIEE